MKGSISCFVSALSNRQASVSRCVSFEDREICAKQHHCRPSMRCTAPRGAWGNGPTPIQKKSNVDCLKMFWLYLIALWECLVPIRAVVLKQQFSRLTTLADAPTTRTPGRSQGLAVRAARLTIGIFLALGSTLGRSWQICFRGLARVRSSLTSDAR
jgi:hypothetical protein